MRSIITFTTDFGRDSSYVAAMKGVILSINSAAVIVDISHAVAPQNIVEGAFVLGEATRWFPRDSIHVAVVDPGVGTSRKIVFAQIDEQKYLCPDNGLLSYICRDRQPERAFEVTNRSLFLADVSNTFHGRDIMAPVAAQLSLGLPPQQLGPRLETLQTFEWPRPERRNNAVIGRILCADAFGNLISNIGRENLPSNIEAACFLVETPIHQFAGIVKTYAESPPGAPVALFGSSGLLELAIVQGNAAVQLQIPIGECVSVRWQEHN